MIWNAARVKAICRQIRSELEIFLEGYFCSKDLYSPYVKEIRYLDSLQLFLVTIGIVVGQCRILLVIPLTGVNCEIDPFIPNPLRKLTALHIVLRKFCESHWLLRPVAHFGQKNLEWTFQILLLDLFYKRHGEYSQVMSCCDRKFNSAFKSHQSLLKRKPPRFQYLLALPWLSLTDIYPGTNAISQKTSLRGLVFQLQLV